MRHGPANAGTGRTCRRTRRARPRSGWPERADSECDERSVPIRGMDTIAADGGWQSTSDGFRCATISEAIMRVFLSMVMVLGVCGLAGAADEKAVDPVGTWKCEYEIGGQQRTSTLKTKKDGDNLTGTMAWPDQDEAKLKDLKLKDGTLTFSAVRKLAGMDDGITVEYKLKIDGDQLKGKGAAEFGGEKREWDIEAKREKNK